MKSKCPNPDCDGEDSSYMVDDYTPHECDECGTTWGTYDPKERVENAINIKIRNTGGLREALERIAKFGKANPGFGYSCAKMAEEALE